MTKNLFLLFLLFFNTAINAQSAADAAVQLSVSVQANPAQITLNWIANTTTNQYQVFRKLKSATSWGTAVAVLPGTTMQYIDNNVTAGTNYEYRVIRTANNYAGYGYVNCGIEVPEIEYRGKLLLIVDSTMISPLSVEISRLMYDIEGDGWEVIRKDVLRNGSVTHVKSIIIDEYNLDPLNLKCVFLLGHIPVPYSGNINPDGHTDHQGAWPADVYYGDVNGTWTDNFGPGTSTNSPSRTQNHPNDGKFDQSLVPGDVELQVGRVDLAGMPSFSITETQLLKNYLDKDHDYRKKIFSPQKRAVVDDNFGYFGSEAFAASGYKNFGPLVGSGNVVNADYITTLASGSYLWAYGCGGGSYTSAGGIGTTSNFVGANLQGVFSMLFGSYFGDWDSQNNFLKAPLAQGKCLTNVWSGRPHYQFHHMGLGENIGYGLLQTQNNPGNIYYGGPTAITGKWIHNALMGDPTLRNDIVAPPSNVVATKVGYNCHISWSATTETNIAGYNIFMKNDSAASFVKINTAPVTGTTFTDNCLMHKGVYTYMVRTLKLESTPSGSYFNMSEGLKDTANNNNNFSDIAQFTTTTTGNTVTVTAISGVSSTYLWDYGNGATGTAASSVIVYPSNGTFIITLIATHPCFTDTSSVFVTITGVGIDEINNLNSIKIFPNPSCNSLCVSSRTAGDLTLTFYNSEGRKVHSITQSFNDGCMNLSHLPRGIYLVEVNDGNSRVIKKFILQ